MRQSRRSPRRHSHRSIRKPARRPSRGIAVLEGLEPRLLLSAVAWDGGGDGTSWSNALNWSGDVLPGASDDVTIDVAGTPTIVFNSAAGTVSVRSVTCAETFSLTGGSLTVTSGASQFSGNFTMSGGTLKAAGSGVTLSIAGATTTITGGTLVADAGANIALSTATSLTGVGVTASGGGQVLFPAATSYASINSDDATLSASGAGSKIDLSHLTTFRGGGNSGYNGTTHVLVTSGGEIDLAGAVTNSGGNLNDFTLDGTGGILGVGGITSLSGTSLTVGAGQVLSFDAVTSLTNVNVAASAGGQIVFPAATSYASVNIRDATLSASGAGSKIDLSHLTTFRGGGGGNNGATHVLVASGGEIDLAGDIGNNGGNANDFSITGAGSVLGVAGITKLDHTNLTAASPGLTFSSATSLTGSNLTAGAGVTLSFPVATSLTGIGVTASGGGQVLFPAATSYASINSDDATLSASGAGSKIDLSHLTTFRGGGNSGYNGTTHVLVTSGGEIDLAGDIGNNGGNANDFSITGAGGVLGVAGITKLDHTNLTAASPGLTFSSATSLTGSNLTAGAGVTLSFPVATSLTGIGVTASGGGQVLFPAATSYASINSDDATLSASGAGSKIDLSHLTTFRGGGNSGYNGTTHVLVTSGGEIDLAGDIGNNGGNANDFSITGAGGVLGVAGITKLDHTNLTAASPGLTFSSATSLTGSNLTAGAGVTLSFPVATSLTGIGVTASGGGQVLFPAATSYASINSDDATLSASGAGSKIDLSHLTTFRGGGNSGYNGTTHVLVTSGGEIDLAGAVTNSGGNLNDFTLDGTGGILGVGGITSLSGTSLTVGAGQVLSFDAVTSLTNVNVAASAGGQIVFPAATSYASVNIRDATLSASGAGSKIDLSHLTTFRGGGGGNNGATHVLVASGGEIDLAGDIGNNGGNANDFSITGAGSVLGVAGITKLDHTNLTAASPGLTFSSATSLTGSNLTAGAGVTLSFPVATSLTGIGVTASGGGQVLFPAATSYASINSDDATLSASGAGSKIDLSHLTTFRGGGNSGYNGTTHVLVTSGGEIDLAGDIGNNGGNANDFSITGAGSVLGVAGITKLDHTNLTAASGAAVTFVGIIRIGPGSTWTTTGAGSRIVNQGTITLDAVTLTVTGDGFVNSGTVDLRNGGKLDVNGSMAVSGAGLLTGTANGTISVTGNLLGDTRNSLNAPAAAVRLDGTGTSAAPQLLEAMAVDYGNRPAGLTGNFAFGSLTLVGTTYVKLVDQSDNSFDGRPEAVYVDTLTVPAGATLDLNGLHLYARTANVQGTVTGLRIVSNALPGDDAYEPDNTLDEPYPIATDGTPQVHSIGVPGDVDWITFTLGQPSKVTIETRPAPGDPTGGRYDDTALWLYDSSGTNLIAYADDGGIGQFSRLQRTGSSMLPAGTYCVKIAEASGLSTISGYTVFVVTQDTVRPQVLPFTPRPDGTFVVDFSKTMLPGNVDNGEDLQVVSDTTGAVVPGTIRWSRGDTRMIWQPSQRPTAVETWHLTLKGEDASDFVDTFWNPLAGGTYQQTWTVWPSDVTSPIVASATGYTAGSITLAFNEAMRGTGLGAGAVTVTNGAGAAVAGTVTWNAWNLSLTWTPSAGPSARDTWTIALSGQAADGLVDAWGNNVLDGDADGDAGGNYSTSWVVGPAVPPQATFKGAPDGTVTIEFDQPILPTTDIYAVSVVDAADPTHRLAGEATWSEGGTRLTWRPNLSAGAPATWQVTLSAGQFISISGLALDGNADGSAGGDFTRPWSVGSASAAALTVLAFEGAADGSATIDFSGRVMTSLVDAGRDVVVTDPGGNRIEGSITWTNGDTRMIWQPSRPPADGEQWTIRLGTAYAMDFVDVASNGLGGVDEAAPGQVLRQWRVTSGAVPTTATVDRLEGSNGNNDPASATVVDVSAGATALGGLSIHSSNDVDWFSFTTSATGTVSDRVFIDADVHGGALSLWLCSSDGTWLQTGADDTGAPAGAVRTTVSLSGLPAGTYKVRVAGGINAAYSLTVQPPYASGQETWTVLYYIAGDNNLDEGYYRELDAMERLNLPSTVNVAVLYDRAPGLGKGITDDWADTRQGFLAHDTTVNLLGGWLQSVGEQDMGRPQMLASFIAWAVAQHPITTHYVLNLVNHGDGENGICTDVTDGNDFLSPGEIDQALSSAGTHFDMVVIDTCLTGMAEMATVLAPHADYMVASEEITYTGSMPTQLGLLEASALWTPRTLADAMAQRTAALHPGASALQVTTQDNKTQNHDFYITESAVDLSRITALNAALRDFVQTVDRDAPASPSSAQWARLRKAIGASTWFFNQSNRDLGKLMQAIADDTTILASIRDKASAVLSALRSAVVGHYGNAENTAGLAVTLPWDLTWDYEPFGGAFSAASAWDQFLSDLPLSTSKPNFTPDWAEPNDWEQDAYPLHQAQGPATLPDLTIDSPGDKDIFRFELAAQGDAGSLVRAWAVDEWGNAIATWSPSLEVYEANGVRHVLTDGGAGGAAQISLANLPAGLYYVRVASDGVSSGHYRLSLETPLSPTGTDWAGDNHSRPSAYPITLNSGKLEPYVGLQANAIGDWFAMDLSDLTNGGDGYIDVAGQWGGTVHLVVLDAGGNTLFDGIGTQERYAIPAGTVGQVQVGVFGPAGATLYAMTVQAPSYYVPFTPPIPTIVLLRQWDSGAAHVAIYGLTGTTLGASDVTVKFGKKGDVTSVSLGKNATSADLGIVVWGASSVGKIEDTRKGGTVTFICSSSPVQTISLNNALSGADINGLTLGGLVMPLDIDGDGSSSDKTGLYLTTSHAKGTAVTIKGWADGDIVTSGLVALTVNGRMTNGDIVLKGWVPKAPTLKFGEVSDVDLRADMSIKSLNATNWLGTQGISTFSAPWLGTTKIAWDVRSTRWDIGGDLASTTIGGTVDDSTFFVTGNIAGLTVGAANHSDFMAGVQGWVSRTPLIHDDFDPSHRTLKAFTVKGLKGHAKSDTFFTDCNVSAGNLGTITLLNADWAAVDLFAAAGSPVKQVKYTDQADKTRNWTYPKNTAPDGVIHIL